MKDGFWTLSEYERGRAQMAIEWVARSQKPIVEIGGRPVRGCDLKALAGDLGRCIETSGESVRAFVIPDRIKGYCCYGFYRYPWAINALLFAWGIASAVKDADQSLWLQGLVFGYSPEAIQRFISSPSSAPKSNLHRCPCIRLSRHRKVEIYGSLARLVQLRSNRSGKYRKSGC
jgi:hypothetical protein